MAYCKSCGAYIPDGQTRCLACGKTEEETEREKRATAGTATADASEERDLRSGEYHYASEKMKEELEKQRKRQQEYDRKWAETEKARRDKERKSREQSRVNNETEKSRTGDVAPETARIFAVFSYLWVGCFIPMLLCPGNDFAMYHAKQGLRLFIAGTVVSLLASIIGLGWLSTLGYLYMAYQGMKNALKGRKEPLPYIGK